jgi:uncharacterized membrane protein
LYTVSPDDAHAWLLLGETGARLAAAKHMSQHDGHHRQPDPTTENIKAIVEVERQALRRASFGERVGQAISDVVGTMMFVTVHTAIMIAWIAWNGLAPSSLRFDPYPFGLLTFIVSLEGVLIATFVLIAQNRMSRQSDERDHLSLQISMLAEQELTLILKLLRRVSDRLGLPPQSQEEVRAEKLSEETNVFELVRTLREQLPEVEGGSSPRGGS